MNSAYEYNGTRKVRANFDHQTGAVDAHGWECFQGRLVHAVMATARGGRRDYALTDVARDRPGIDPSFSATSELRSSLPVSAILIPFRCPS